MNCIQWDPTRCGNSERKKGPDHQDVLTLVSRDQTNSFLYVGRGNSFLYVGRGNSFLYVGRGNSFLYVGRGNSFLYVGRGNSFLYVGRGNFPSPCKGKNWSGHVRLSYLHSMYFILCKILHYDITWQPLKFYDEKKFTL